MTAKGTSLSEDAKNKISIAAKVRWENQEFRRAMSDKQKGREVSDATKKKLSVAAKERMSDPVVRQGISVTMTDKWKDEEYRSLQLASHNTQQYSSHMSYIVSGLWKGEDSVYRTENRSRLHSDAMRAHWCDKDSVYNSEEFRHKKSEKSLGMWSDETIRSKILRSMRSDENRQKCRKGWLCRRKSFTYLSEKCGVEMTYRSSWELVVLKACEENSDVVYFCTEAICIPYEYDGRTRRYFPDVLVMYLDGDWDVIEVKPAILVDYPINQAKFAAARDVFGERFHILTEMEIFGQ